MIRVYRTRPETIFTAHGRQKRESGLRTGDSVFIFKKTGAQAGSRRATIPQQLVFRKPGRPPAVLLPRQSGTWPRLSQAQMAAFSLSKGCVLRSDALFQLSHGKVEDDLDFLGPRPERMCVPRNVHDGPDSDCDGK